MIRPHPDVRRWQRRGSKHQGKAQGRPLHTGATGKGKTGQVSESDTFVDASLRVPLEMGRNAGGQGLPPGSGDGDR